MAEPGKHKQSSTNSQIIWCDLFYFASTKCVQKHAANAPLSWKFSAPRVAISLFPSIEKVKMAMKFDQLYEVLILNLLIRNISSSRPQYIVHVHG